DSYGGVVASGVDDAAIEGVVAAADVQDLFDGAAFSLAVKGFADVPGEVVVTHPAFVAPAVGVEAALADGDVGDFIFFVEVAVFGEAEDAIAFTVVDYAAVEAVAVALDENDLFDGAAFALEVDGAAHLARRIVV